MSVSHYYVQHIYITSPASSIQRLFRDHRLKSLDFHLKILVECLMQMVLVRSHHRIINISITTIPHLPSQPQPSTPSPKTPISNASTSPLPG